MELWVGSNVTRFFFFFFLVYCCLSYSTCILFFSSPVYIVSCHICITFFDTLPLIFVSLNVENVGENDNNNNNNKSYKALFFKQS